MMEGTWIVTPLIWLRLYARVPVNNIWCTQIEKWKEIQRDTMQRWGHALQRAVENNTRLPIMGDIPRSRPKGQVKEISSWNRERCMENATSLQNFPLKEASDSREHCRNKHSNLIPPLFFSHILIFPPLSKPNQKKTAKKLWVKSN